jgi:hypothetical protein
MLSMRKTNSLTRPSTAANGASIKQCVDVDAAGIATSEMRYMGTGAAKTRRAALACISASTENEPLFQGASRI